MSADIVTVIAFLFMIVFIFDISFNLRRISRNFDRLLRKLGEIAELLQKKY